MTNTMLKTVTIDIFAASSAVTCVVVNRESNIGSERIDGQTAEMRPTIDDCSMWMFAE
jgi:hypothetical protein